MIKSTRDSRHDPVYRPTAELDSQRLQKGKIEGKGQCKTKTSHKMVRAKNSPWHSRLVLWLRRALLVLLHANFSILGLISPKLGRFSVERAVVVRICTKQNKGYKPLFNNLTSVAFFVRHNGV